jgi:hypothetical protein
MENKNENKTPQAQCLQGLSFFYFILNCKQMAIHFINKTISKELPKLEIHKSNVYKDSIKKLDFGSNYPSPTNNEITFN